MDSYKAIDAKMDEGTRNRTVAATNMNATSSRAHTIVGIQFVQKQKNKAGQEMAKTSIVNLVDLAGRSVIYLLLVAPVKKRKLGSCTCVCNLACGLLSSCCQCPSFRSRMKRTKT